MRIGSPDLPGTGSVGGCHVGILNAAADNRLSGCISVEGSDIVGYGWRCEQLHPNSFSFQWEKAI
ncbi:hypothetical protein [Microseira wollei]|uniref:hypothetical protein n=1 Tax=Microseira wollei TaxID=467598 RepID=UPI001CFD248B|nr:hypothetical protein [Microseira wollei]